MNDWRLGDYFYVKFFVIAKIRLPSWFHFEAALFWDLIISITLNVFV